MPKVDEFISELFQLGSEVRYVAVYVEGKLAFREAQARQGQSSNESDKYEELLVNPNLIGLARQRGNIDCGGLEYLLVRYGNFFQFVCPVPCGHVSVCIEKDSNIDVWVPKLLSAITASFGKK